MNSFHERLPAQSGAGTNQTAPRGMIARSCFRRSRWWPAALGILLSCGVARAAEPPAGDFGKSIELAPFVVKGKPLSISIHARTKADRRYAEKFADEVVEIVYETLDDSTGRGLVIVGSDGDPHPVFVMRKFLAMAREGQLDDSITPSASELDATLTKWERRVERHSGDGMNLDFDVIVNALPIPLEGVAASLYQLAWAEDFVDARIESRLKTLTFADLTRNDLTRYDWVFYLPPHGATKAALKEMINKGLAKSKMGVLKRAAVRSALVVFSPVVRKGIEGMRKGMLFMTVMRAESPYSEEDINALTNAYIKELMPDLKPGSGDEKGRALAAIEKQKIVNAEYAKDPFVKPDRVVNSDPTLYEPFEGEYTLEPPQVTHRFKREGDSFHWTYKDRPPMVFYPAGDRLFVIEDGSMTIRFLVDDDGAVTGVEERWVRRRQTVPRKA